MLNSSFIEAKQQEVSTCMGSFDKLYSCCFVATKQLCFTYIG